MYQKITDGFVDMDRQKKMEYDKWKKQQSLQPMSYIMCPECDNPDIEKCECVGGKNNYYCKMCRFSYIDHHHSSSISDGSKSTKNIDRSIMAKVIRK